MRRRDEAATHFMHIERRAAAERLADAQATARSTAHRRNLEAARAAMVAAEQCLAEADQAGGCRWQRHAIAAKTRRTG
jgi:hypothetical protein